MILFDRHVLGFHWYIILLLLVLAVSFNINLRSMYYDKENLTAINNVLSSIQ